MNTSSFLTRREFLRLTGMAGLLITGNATLGACTQAALPVPTGMTAPSDTPTAGIPNLNLTLRAAPSKVQILPGTPTTVWSYQPQIEQGDPASVQIIPGSYLGPIIRVRTGERVRITFINDLPESQPSIFHWHGLHLPADMDGQPHQVVPPGGRFVYEFTVTDRAGTYWFHPHPHGLIGHQVLMGLAGLFIVTDPEAQVAGLPTGDHDLPLVIQDRSFDTQNQFITTPAMMQQLMGFLGDRVLVNGQLNVQLDLATRAYRLRLLNGSNSRIYKLAWHDDTPLTVIGSDGGLLASPVKRSFVMLAPGERIELWADFRDRPIGTELTLRSLAFTGAEGGMGQMGETGGTSGNSGNSGMGNGMGGRMGGGMGGSSGGMGNGSSGGMGNGMNGGNAPALGAALDILRVRIARQEPETLTLPTTLSTLNLDRVEDALNRNAPRPVALTLRGGQWQINGKTFEMGTVAANEIVKLNTLEVWEIINETNPGEALDAMGMAHPIHIHGRQFQVIGRTIRPELRAGWESVQAGYVDEGWKDTVLVMPGERVQLLMRFRDHLGDFVYHCHNLEHEDAGMMRMYRVAA